MGGHLPRIHQLRARRVRKKCLTAEKNGGENGREPTQKGVVGETNMCLPFGAFMGVEEEEGAKGVGTIIYLCTREQHPMGSNGEKKEKDQSFGGQGSRSGFCYEATKPWGGTSLR